MITVYRNSVQSWEIDQMGHMNVQFYFEKALQGCVVLWNKLGIKLIIEIINMYIIYILKKYISTDLKTIESKGHIKKLSNIYETIPNIKNNILMIFTYCFSCNSKTITVYVSAIYKRFNNCWYPANVI